MIATLDEVRDAVSHWPNSDKARLLMSVAADVVGAFPGIDFDPAVCGGDARIVRTRIPVWTLESCRRQGLTEGAILQAFPGLRAEDIVNAWAYVRAHRVEMDRQIAENEDA